MGIVDDVKSSADWMGKALSSSGYAADFSAPSLWEIDRFFDEQAPEGEALPGGLLAEDLGVRLFGVGSYVGEVIRRELGGEWEGDDEDPRAEINVALRVNPDDCVWPVQRALKRFSNGYEDGIAVYGAALGLEVGTQPHPPRRKRRWFGR